MSENQGSHRSGTPYGGMFLPDRDAVEAFDRFPGHTLSDRMLAAVSQLEVLHQKVVEAYDALTQIEDLSPDCTEEAVEIARGALASGIVEANRG